MKSIPTRIAVLALAMLFLCGNLLSYPFYRFALSQAKAEIHRELFGLSEQDLKQAQVFSFTDSEFEKYSEDGNELCMNGNWYDIISTGRSADGKMLVKCFSDKKESLLHAWLNRSVNDDGSLAAPVKGGKQMKLAFSGDYMPVQAASLGFSAAAAGLSFGSSSFSAPVSGGHSSLPEMPPRA